ncbi:MAG: hypothetical protein P8Y71_15965 [Pseudolabrys sp.]
MKKSKIPGERSKQVCTRRLRQQQRGAPSQLTGVQAKYSPADLAQIFSSLRDNHVDLNVVALAAPKLSAPPKLQGNGQLRLTGHFSSQPRQINFDLLFQAVAGEWKWLGISVTAPNAPPSAAKGAANSGR